MNGRRTLRDQNLPNRMNDGDLVGGDIEEIEGFIGIAVGDDLRLGL